MIQPAAPGYRRIALPLPFALRSVNAYLVEGDGAAIVDCGLHTESAERALIDGLAQAGLAPKDVRDVFVTHLHPDHIGMAGWLEKAGARVRMHAPEAEAARAMWFGARERIDIAVTWFREHGMPEKVLEGMADAWLGTAARVDPIARIDTARDGEVIELAGRRFQLVWTPGHTDYHAVLVDLDERVLVAGDHVLPRITPNIGLYPYGREDPLGDFIAALERVSTLDVRRVLPAHGEPFDDLVGRAREIIAHHRARLEVVREALTGTVRTAYELATSLFPNLRSPHEERFAIAETLAHLRHLELRGQVLRDGAKPVRWRLSSEVRD